MWPWPHYPKFGLRHLKLIILDQLEWLTTLTRKRCSEWSKARVDRGLLTMFQSKRCTHAWQRVLVKWERSHRQDEEGVEGQNVVLVWVGGGDFICERTVHIWHFFGLGHSRFHLYKTTFPIEKSEFNISFSVSLIGGVRFVCEARAQLHCTTRIVGSTSANYLNVQFAPPY